MQLGANVFGNCQIAFDLSLRLPTAREEKSDLDSDFLESDCGTRGYRPEMSCITVQTMPIDRLKSVRSFFYHVYSVERRRGRNRKERTSTQRCVPNERDERVGETHYRSRHHHH